MKPTYIHLVASAYKLPIHICSDRVARFLWERLRRAFPFALAVCLMPNHIHVVCLSSYPERDRRRLASVLSGLRRSHNPGAAIRFDPVPAPTIIVGRDKLARHIRYVVLNPCRDGLCDDPLSWPWSTHRDAVGAISDPWVTSDRLEQALGALGRPSRLHHYVSADPSTAVAGTPLPVALDAETLLPSIPLSFVADAAAAATRAPRAAIRSRTPTRALFIALAQTVGWRDARVLGEATRITPNAVRRRRRQQRPRVQAAALCLADARLRAHPAACH